MKNLSSGLLVLGAALCGVALLLAIFCIENGVISPSTATGQTYPVDMHGMLYVTAPLGLTYEGSLYTGAFAGILGVILRALAYRQTED
jgi:hypothetical protein